MIPHFHTQNVILLDYTTKTVMLRRWVTQFCAKWKGWVVFSNRLRPHPPVHFEQSRRTSGDLPQKLILGEGDRLSAYDAIR